MRNIFAFAVTLVCFGCDNPAPSVCMPACAPGFNCVDGACVPGGEMPDMAHGDDGGNAGKCDPPCGGLTPYCNGSSHCVGCTMDAQCPQGKYCKIVSDTQASCVIGCMNDDRCGGGKCCDGACADVSSDGANCGSCGKSCAAPHAQSTCANGQCVAGNCDPGWGDCDGDPMNGCEANLHADVANCTACGMDCNKDNKIVHDVPGCADGCYVAACDFGYDNCDDDDKNGCETVVLTDVNNCGGCSVPCKALPNAKATCTQGNCVLGACNMGFENCNGDPKDGCEANFQLDPNNCGGCGNVCPMQTPSCVNGVCGTLYTFSGVQQNLPVASLGGWTECYKDNYANNATPVATVLQKCPGSQLLIACRPNGAATLTLAAMGPRADVLFDCNTNQTCVHVANGVGFYFSASYSWGFVKGGDTVSRNSCDTGNTNPDLRMCWHTGNGNMNSGYRCGNNFLNGNAGWDRLVYTSN